MNRTLRWQLALILFPWILVFATLLCLFNISILQDNVMKINASQAEGLADDFARWMQQTIPKDDYNQRYFIHQGAPQGEIKPVYGLLGEVQVYDLAGAVLFDKRHHERLGRPEPNPEFFAIAQSGKPYHRYWIANETTGEPVAPLGVYNVFQPQPLSYEIITPLRYGDTIVGALHTSMRLDKIPGSIRVIFYGNAILAVVFIVAAFFAVARWGDRAIAQPLHSLLQAQRRLGRGEFDIYMAGAAGAGGGNELVTVAESFNEMAAALQKSRRDLEDNARRLETVNEDYRALLDRLEEEVQVKTRELREFFSMVTHDLKIPLAAIQGYSELLQRPKSGPLTERQAAFVHSIMVSCRHLQILVKNMLDTVKYEQGTPVFLEEEVQLPELVADVHRTLAPLMEDKRLQYDVVLDEGCRWVRADRTKLSQVLTNILSNAIHFTPPGGAITLRAAAVDEVARISVSDTGPGIPEEWIPRLFEKFSQVPGQHEASTGVGLGLYIVKQIVEGHGQQVWVENTPGEGATVCFTLALAPAPSPSGMPADASAASPRGTPRAGGPEGREQAP